MTIKVRTYEPHIVDSRSARVVMIPFSAETQGKLFCGKTTENGIDTQYITSDGDMRLSARYILVGKDTKGNNCRIFIENTGTSLDNCKPTIYTDSPVLEFLENAELFSVVEQCPGGVTVKIFASCTCDINRSTER